MNLYLTGGAVRNHMLGLPAKDYDFSVEASSFDEMLAALMVRGLKVWQSRPEFVTVRGQMDLSALGSFGGLMPRGVDCAFNADFTLCRKEAMYSDLRHPDVVTPTNLLEDLSRRDFTVNAVAVSEHGIWFDAYGGRSDAHNRVLDTVGNPDDRFCEDPLRMLRAVRFAVVYRLRPTGRVMSALNSITFTENLRALPHERVREELNRALSRDWYETGRFLFYRCPMLGAALGDFYPNLWLKATTETP